ncbi:hypothetical protein ACR3K2_03620 [Cryptosporidium serpentis]
MNAWKYIKNKIFGNLKFESKYLTRRFISNPKIYPEDEYASIKRESNKIRTSKYNLINFLPLNLFLHITRFCNLYILAMAIMQLIPDISDSGGKPSLLIPLTIILCVSCTKDALDDIKRHKSDWEENNRAAIYFSTDGSLKKKKWEDIEVGDIVKIYDGEYFPADLILLHSSDSCGVVFIETKNLDGETNLKGKACIADISKLFIDESFVGKIRIKFECETPSEKLYSFSGSCHITSTNNPEEFGETIDIGYDQFLPRGASLGNTEWCYGCVVYAGHQTRIFRNSCLPRYKWSHLESTIQKHVGILVFLQIISCLFIAFLSLSSQFFDKFTYQIINHHIISKIDLSSSLTSGIQNSVKNFFIVLGSVVVLFTLYIPIDLIILLEIVRTIQVYFLTSDKRMCDPINGTYATCQSTNLLEELGNITHIFADKTGTITENNMKVKYIYFDVDNSKFFNICYFEDENMSLQQNDYVSSLWKSLLCSEENYDSLKIGLLILSTCHTCLATADPINSFNNSSQDVIHESNINFTIRAAYPLRYRSDGTQLLIMKKVHYHSTSPDELAILEAVKLLGVEFWKRPHLDKLEIILTTHQARLVVLGQKLYNEYCKILLNICKFVCNSEYMGNFHQNQGLLSWILDIYQLLQDKIRNDPILLFNYAKYYIAPLLQFDVLDSLQFDHERRRMSVIIQETYMKPKSFLNNSLNITTLPSELPSEYLHFKKLLLVKGADTSIFKIALLDNKSRDLTESIIYKLSSNGLRTLVLGYRYLEEGEYRTYLGKIHHLDDSLVDTVANLEELTEFSKLSLRDPKYSNYNSVKTIEISAFIEQKINIIGIIGIEDKLQEGVPELISDIKDADIRLWVLTGDKLETAVNIGYSCNLLDQMTYNAIIDGKSFEAITSQLKYCCMYSGRKKKSNPLEIELESLNPFMLYSNFPTQSKVDNPESPLFFKKYHPKHSNKQTKYFGDIEQIPIQPKGDHILPKSPIHEKIYSVPLYLKEDFSDVEKSENNEYLSKLTIQEIEVGMDNISLTNEIDTHCHKYSITITGSALDIIVTDSKLLNKFFTLALKASTILACRVSPRQKSILLQLYTKFNPKVCSLAIGDGANDVGMIISANVGIGIFGREGTQAAKAADFGISKFSHLRSLLFFHGKEALRKNSTLIYFNIFKNISFCMTAFAFSYYNGFSGLDIYNPWAKQLYGLIFVTVPVIVFAVLDKNLPRYVLEESQLLYKTPPCRIWPFGYFCELKDIIAECLNLKNKLISNPKELFKKSSHCESYGSKTKSKYIYPYTYIKCQIVKAALFVKYIMLPNTNKRKHLKINTRELHTCIAKLYNSIDDVPEKVREYGTGVLFIWILYAYYVAATLVIVPLVLLQYGTSLHWTNGQLNSNGQTNMDIESVGMCVYGTTIFTANALLCCLINSWFIFNLLALVFVGCSYLLIWLIASSVPCFLNFPGLEQIYGSFIFLHTTPIYYIACIATCTLALLPFLFFMGIHIVIAPTKFNIIKERLVMGVFDIVIGKNIHNKLTVLVSRISNDIYKDLTPQIDETKVDS